MKQDQKPFHYIDTPGALEAFCARVMHDTPFMAVDTEFARESTYFSKLSTIQIATESETALIDPLVNNLSLDPLKGVFTNPDIIKIFHAARQDLEIFYHLWGVLPTPIADTQIIAMVNGFGDSVGYQGLVKSTLSITLNKDCRVSNWLQRPLSKEQISYAMGDVLYLIEIYKILLKRTESRLHWVNEELEILSNPDTYAIKKDEVWKRLSIPVPIGVKEFSRIKALAAWREGEAVTQDKPRHHIIKDQVLLDLARTSRPAQKIKDLVGQKHIKKNYEPPLMACLENVEAISELPESLIPPPCPSTSETLVVDILKVLYKMVANEHAIAPKLLCTIDVLKELVRGKREGLNVLEGWRLDIFGKQALSLLEGKNGFKVKGKKVKLVEVG
jgi:ribonuclease D